MKFWKTMVSDWVWWMIMAVLFFLQLPLFCMLGLVHNPWMFAAGFWIPTPLWYYTIVYKKQRN